MSLQNATKFSTESLCTMTWLKGRLFFRSHFPNSQRVECWCRTKFHHRSSQTTVQRYLSILRVRYETKSRGCKKKEAQWPGENRAVIYLWSPSLQSRIFDHTGSVQSTSVKPIPTDPPLAMANRSQLVSSMLECLKEKWLRRSRSFNDGSFCKPEVGLFEPFGVPVGSKRYNR